MATTSSTVRVFKPLHGVLDNFNQVTQVSNLDPAEEVGGPEEDGHGGDAGPDHRLVGQVHAVQVRAQDLNLKISVLGIWDRMFLGLLDPDPDPLVRCTDSDPSLFTQMY